MISSKKLSAERLSEIENFNDTTNEDLPDLTPDVLSSIHFAHPENFKTKVVKKTVTLRLDADVLDYLKSKGKGYQTRINEILRKYAFG